MPDLHPAVRITDTLRATARELEDAQETVARCDDPAALMQNLYGVIDSLEEALPAVLASANIEADGDLAVRFTAGLKMTRLALADAQGYI